MINVVKWIAIIIIFPVFLNTRLTFTIRFLSFVANRYVNKQHIDALCQCKITYLSSENVLLTYARLVSKIVKYLDFYSIILFNCRFLSFLHTTVLRLSLSHFMQNRGVHYRTHRMRRGKNNYTKITCKWRIPSL